VVIRNDKLIRVKHCGWQGGQSVYTISLPRFVKNWKTCKVALEKQTNFAVLILWVKFFVVVEFLVPFIVCCHLMVNKVSYSICQCLLVWSVFLSVYAIACCVKHFYPLPPPVSVSFCPALSCLVLVDFTNKRVHLCCKVLRFRTSLTDWGDVVWV